VPRPTTLGVECMMWTGRRCCGPDLVLPRSRRLVEVPRPYADMPIGDLYAILDC
jgi:hypothetical protein